MAVFKAYDIRGVYPTQLDAGFGRRIGVSLGRFYRSVPENAGKEKLRIVVGRDMRLSAPEMTAALIDGLLRAGVDVIDIGMTTTPCCYFAVQRLSADGGVQCTASHNPPQYIGFKVCRELAIPVSYDTGLNAVEKALDHTLPAGPAGAMTTLDVDEQYLDFVASQAKSLKPIKVAADASNGMAGKYLPRLFKRLGTPFEGLFLEPDGRFPNHGGDPLVPENLAFLQKFVVESGSAIGFCFDGDADRVAIVDENGTAVGCDLITALIAQAAVRERPGSVATYDLRSSKVVKDAIEEAGGKPLRVRVGHSLVKKTMREVDAICGGELSGHYYFRLQDEHVFYADSALVATVRLLNILSATGKKVSELIAPLRKYQHTGEINFNVADKDSAIAAVREAFKDGEQDFLDGVTVSYPNWWVNVRASNTEPLLRLTLEGDTIPLRDDGYKRVSVVLERFGRLESARH